MEPFRIDFAMNRGHEMMLDRESGIGRNQLYELELHMLMAGPIPCLLPLDWIEIDGKVTFRYRLTGYRMLLHRLQREPITMEQFCGLLLGVADALLACRDYMLRPEGCLLNERFIYVAEQLSDIRLVYVPIRAEERTENREYGDLMSLAVKWTAYVDKIDGEALRAILQLFNDNKWPLAELRDLLLRLIGASGALRPAGEARGAVPPGRPTHEDGMEARHSSRKSAKPKPRSAAGTAASDAALVPAPPGNEPAAPKLWEQQHSAASQPHGANKAAEPEPAYSPPGVPLGRSALQRASAIWKERQERRYLEDDEPEPSRLTASGQAEPEEDELTAWTDDAESAAGRRGKWLLAAVVLVITACAWRFIYVEAPSSRSLLMSAGLTLMLLAGGALLWKRREPLPPEEADEEDEEDDEEEASEPFMPDRRRWGTWSRDNEAAADPEATTSSLGSYSVSGSIAAGTHAGAASAAGGSESGAVTTHPQAASSPKPASLAGASSSRAAAPALPPTVLFGSAEDNGDDEGESGTASLSEKVYLHRVWNGREETIELAADCFKIGRAVDGEGYAEQAEGVSRLHVEIERSGGEHLVKDLGSRNGSLLNGVLMVPYKTYKLTNGDTLHLGGDKGPSYMLKIG